MCSYEYIKYIIHYGGWGLACFVSVHIPIPLHAALIKWDRGWEGERERNKTHGGGDRWGLQPRGDPIHQLTNPLPFSRVLYSGIFVYVSFSWY